MTPRSPARGAVDRAAARQTERSINGENRHQFLTRKLAEGMSRDDAQTMFTRMLFRQEQDEAASPAGRAKQAADARAVQVRAAAASGTLDVRVGKEPSTYQRGGEHSFLRDALAQWMSRGGAGIGGTVAVEVEERLARHQAEHAELGARTLERAASDTSNFAGLVIPQFIVHDMAPLARAGRPFANICRHRALPPQGMKVDISRITTGASTAVQASEGAAMASQAIDDTLLQVPVSTIGGFADISIQAAMRSMADQALVEDAILDYHTQLDAQILVLGDGTGQKPLSVVNTPGIGAATYVDATTPTVPEAWVKLSGAAKLVDVGVFRRATHFVMRPERLEWFLAGLDPAGRPVIGEIGGPIPGYLQLAPDTGPTSQGNSGFQLGGKPVVTDANIPSTLGGGTEDEIFAVAADEHYLYEDPRMPLAMRFEQVAATTGQIRIVVFGWFAFTAGRRPTASAVLTGSGLASPVF